ETERSVSKLPSILIYLVDTLRSDHLGCYGYPRDISPRIDAFAADSILFEEAVGQSTWTRPAVATLLTGLWPVAHGANQRGEKLSSEALTLAEVLRDAGYRTAAFVSNPNVSGTFGFRQGFDEFFQLQGQPKVRSDVITDRVVRWLDAQSSGAPTFLYVHTADPHNPYLAPEPYRSIYAPTSEREIEEITSNPKKQSWEPSKEVLSSLQDLYDAEIAFTDDSFGNLLDYLRASKMYENTVILFVSDHGEEFAEHGAWTHGKNLHVETLRIPLIARFPEITTGQRIPTYVQQADVFPTILDYLGIGFDPSALDGRSLLHLIDPSSSTAPKPTEPIFSYLHRYGAPSVSVVYDGWKLMQRRSLANPPFRHLYELSSDPHETENLAATLPIRVGYLAALIQRKLADTHHLLSSEEVEIDPELEKSLEALGYLQ
ncbi:MAG: sulfatase, partial [Thermoanaerobaculia bacterium]